MKNLVSSLTSFYKKNTHRVRGIYRKKGIRPGYDWKIIVITFMLCVFCAVCAHIFIYINVKNNSWWASEGADTLYQVKIDNKLLTDTLARFQLQNATVQSLQATNSPSRLADPSL